MKLKALIIDDSQVTRQMIMMFIRCSNLAEFEFAEAEDGADALVKFSQDPPDLIFVDWNMPNMTGIDFVRQVRATEASRRVPIIMVTSEKSLDKVQEAIDAKVNDFICKPFSGQDVTEKLSKIIKTIEQS